MYHLYSSFKAFHASSLLIAITIITSITSIKISFHNKESLEISLLASIVSLFLHGGALIIYFLLEETFRSVDQKLDKCEKQAQELDSSFKVHSAENNELMKRLEGYGNLVKDSDLHELTDYVKKHTDKHKKLNIQRDETSELLMEQRE